MKKRFRIELEFEVESDSPAFAEGDPLAFFAGLITGIIHNAVESYRRDGTHIVSWKYITSRLVR